MSVTARSGSATGRRRRCHAGQQRRQLAKLALRRMRGRPTTAPGPRTGGRRHLGHLEHRGHAGVGARRAPRPTRRGSGVAKAAAKARRMSAWASSSYWCAGQLGAAEGRGTGWRRTWPRWRPPPPTCRRRCVGGVAGVAARRARRGRARVAARGQLLVDGQRHEPQHAVGHRHVEVGALARRGPPGQRGGDGQRGLHAAGGGVGDGGAGQRRRAVGPRRAHGQVAADGEVVDVVAGPLRARAVLAVAARRAVDDARIARRHRLVADAEAVDDAGPEALDHHVGRRPPRPGRRRGPRRPSGRPARAACRGARCRRRTAARSAPRRPTARARPSPPCPVVGQQARAARRRARPSRGRAR